MSGPIIKVLDKRLCSHVQPVARDQSGGTVDEHHCVLLKGHEGFHTDGQGRAWANIEFLMRRLEQENGADVDRLKRKIISIPRKH